MFFWNSLAFSIIQWMLAIWSLVPLPFLKPAWLLTKCVVFFPTVVGSAILWTPAGCPTIPFNSDTNCPVLGETPQVKGSVPQHHLHFRYWSQIPDCNLNFWLTGSKLRFSWPPLQVWQLTRVAYTSQENTLFKFTDFLNKRYNSRAAKWKRCVRQAMGKGVEASYSL